MWLAEGDKNSRFFHNKATQRKKKNWIKGVKDSNGRWQADEGRDAAILEYFNTLFKAADDLGNMDFLQGLASKLTTDMVEQLDMIFTEKEVKLALNEMHPIKAPGPDGMAPLFYQKFWSVVGKDVTDAVLHALNSGQFPTDINHTFVTLIPKKKRPKLMSDHWPISLCNFIY